MADEHGDKVHAPTPQRRERARQQGQVARSQDLVSAGLLASGIIVLLLTGGQLVEFFERLARRQWGGAAWVRIDSDLALEQCRQLAGELAWALAPLLGFLMVIAVLANLGQTGLLFLPDKLAWDFERLDPVRGFVRIFDQSNAFRVGMGLLKMILVATVAGWSLWSERQSLLALAGAETAGIASGLVRSMLWIGLKVSLVLLLLALADYAWQRWRHERDLRMTTQELREELQAQQGDPQVRARRRQLQQQASMERVERTIGVDAASRLAEPRLEGPRLEGPRLEGPRLEEPRLEEARMAEAPIVAASGARSRDN